MRSKNDSGFTLIELMIVVALLGVLLAIAVPTYQGYVESSRRTEARTVLLDTAQQLERCYSTYGQYNDNNCGLIAGGSLDGDIQSESEFYRIDAGSSTLNAATFSLVAVPQGPQATDDCGAFALDHTGRKGVATGTVDECW